jgi:outer membrane lipoprotein carrier protein
MKIRQTLATLAVVLTAAVSFAAQPLELDRAAAILPGSTAQFTHKFTPKGFKSPQIEKGDVIFGPFPTMRWTYETPEQKLFIFDGTKSWFFVPSDRQVTVATLDESRRAQLPFLLLGDPAARDRAFVIKEKKDGINTVVTLQPRAAAAPIRTVVITILTLTHKIQRIDYSDRDGNQTTFELAQQHPTQISEALFRFVPPPGVQVVNAD